TTLMAAARTAWQAAGYTVAGAATAAVAAQNLQAESGKALWHAPPPAGLRYDAWFLDEGRCYALAVNRRDTTFQLVITDLHTGTNLRELWWRPNIR
ncbi:hypothetical protein, partial [Actinoallomurus sp. NPDC050550]|uniref:hypothetical protein n=1 Tax=Actinoallomurus sp. NPDC050550 TaxID=3154937 RepID=UPI0033FB3534